MSDLPESARREAPVERPQSDDPGLLRARGAYGKKISRSVMSRLVDRGPTSVFHYDEADDSFVIETTERVDHFTKAAKERRLSGHDGYTPDRSMRHVALLPPVIVAKLYKQGINVLDNNDWPKVAALLDSPDWQAWRTSEGKISRRPNREFSQVREGWNKRRNK